ncbi:hypothetical protein L0152_07495, partial [bacterium]|nr:hypothetical protein [bacterium]
INVMSPKIPSFLLIKGVSLPILIIRHYVSTNATTERFSIETHSNHPLLMKYCQKLGFVGIAGEIWEYYSFPFYT